MKTKPVRTKRVVRVPGIMPATWVETFADITVTNAAIIKRFLKEKKQRDDKLKFSRWTGRDNV